MDLLRDILVVEYVGDELAASVGFVARRESAAEHEDVAPADMLLHLADRAEDRLGREVAEDRRLDLGAGAAEGAGRVVVAVRTREDGQVGHGVLHRLAPVDERAGCGGALHDRPTVRAAVGIDSGEALAVGAAQRVERHPLAVNSQRFVGRRPAQPHGEGRIEFDGALHHDRTVVVGEQRLLRQLDLRADSVAESHLRQRLGHTAEPDGIARHDPTCGNPLGSIVPQGSERRGIGHTVQIGRDHAPRVDGRNAEGHEHGRHVDLLEGAAHRVLAADRRQPQLDLHPQRTQQRRQRFAPRTGGVHPFEIFLIGETHPPELRTGGHRLGAGLRPVIGAPRRKEGVVAVGHDARRLGVSVDGEFLHRDLRLGALRAAAEGQQHGRSADRRVEHLNEALLRHHVVVRQVGLHALG